MFTKVLGTGSYLPLKCLSNIALEAKLDTSDEWIKERTGISSRHIAHDSETVASMGTKAAQLAIDASGLSNQDVDMIIVATCTSATLFPSSACLIQSALGISKCPAFDLSAACSGFIYALSLANDLIRCGTHQKILVIGSEIMSRVIDWNDRSTCVLFGDGAGAVLLGASNTPGILKTQLHASGKHFKLLTLQNAQGSPIDQAEPINPFISMSGNLLFKKAVTILKDAATQIIVDSKMHMTELDWFVPHQANIRIIKAVAEKLKMPMEKVIITLNQQGNTSSASIPLALDYGIRQQKIKRGQTILLEAFGGGLTWGSALIRY